MNISIEDDEFALPASDTDSTPITDASSATVAVGSTPARLSDSFAGVSKLASPPPEPPQAISAEQTVVRIISLLHNLVNLFIIYTP